MKKNKSCVQITISIFQSGSIIITGAKNIEQIMNAYQFINNIIKSEFNFINNSTSNEKNIENQNNINRKLQRKSRLFYVKKENIINFDKIEFVK
jgi:TATA-box binding protein (TBP) (component of TFIID and TFIIIB)